MKSFLGLCGLFLGLAVSLPAQAALPRPVVVELFTSQGCSNCPEADAVLQKISTHPDYLPLSYHVVYFDKLGWKDPFASKANSERQARYVKQLGLDSLFTPQMVVDGQVSVVGADSPSVAKALKAAHQNLTAFPLSVAPNAAGDALDVIVGDAAHPLPGDAVLYEVHFNRRAITAIRGGENNGMTVENVNNVVAFFPVALNTRYLVPLSSFTEDGIAYLLQSPQGKVLGAAYYIRK